MIFNRYFSGITLVKSLNVIVVLIESFLEED